MHNTQLKTTKVVKTTRSNNKCKDLVNSWCGYTDRLLLLSCNVLFTLLQCTCQGFVLLFLPPTICVRPTVHPAHKSLTQTPCSAMFYSSEAHTRIAGLFLVHAIVSEYFPNGTSAHLAATECYGELKAEKSLTKIKIRT